MLNYIWAGLIILSLGFALAADIGDLRRDTYRNGTPLPVSLTFTQSYSAGNRRLPVTVRLDSAGLSSFYGQTVVPEASYPGELIQSRDGAELHFAKDMTLPEPLATVRSMTSERDNDLRGRVALTVTDSGATGTLV